MAGITKAWRESLRHGGNLDVGAARFSIWRLAQLVDHSALKAVLARLEDFGPAARISAAYIRVFLSRRGVESALSTFLPDPERNTSEVTESWLLACMVDHPGTLPTEWLSRARDVAQNHNGLNFHRGVATNVMAIGRIPSDIAWIKAELRREYDPEIVRAYLVALARAGELDRRTLTATVNRIPRMRTTANYLRNRSKLPSLVWRGNYVRVR